MADVQQVPRATAAVAPPAGNGAGATSATTRVRGRPRAKPVVHLTVAERAARGKAARAIAPRSGHGEWEPAPDRRDPVDLLEEQAASPGAGAGADPLRADAGVAVHVLSRRGVPDGGRSGRDAPYGLGSAAVRRRASVELRCLRRPGSPAGVQHQRLRRDAAGPVRVGRQAARRQLRRRRPRPRLRRQAARGDQSRGDAAPIARRCADFAAMRTSTSGTRASTSTRSPQLSAQRGSRRQRTQFDAQPGQGAHQGQPAGVRQAHDDGRRRAADRQRPAADRADRGRSRPGAGRPRSRRSCTERSAPTGAR